MNAEFDAQEAWVAEALAERDALPKPLKPNGLRRVKDAFVRRIVWAGEALVDLVPGFATSPVRHAPIREADADDRYIWYQSIGYRALRKIRLRMSLTPDDVIYDLGCGKGRAISYFARHNVRKCVGVELMPDLAEAARRNAELLVGRRAEIEIRNEDAVLTDLSDASVVLMFHPFGPTVLRPVIERLDALRHPVWIVYANPTYAGVIARFSRFVVIDRFDIPFEATTVSTLILKHEGALRK